MSIYKDKSDLELVEATRGNGDQQAFAALIKRYERPLYNFILRMMSNPSEAEELFQETFLRIYKNLDSFRGGASFSPWAYRIAHNLCIDALRRPGRKIFTELEKDGEDEVSILDKREDEQASNPEIELHRRQIGLSIQKAVNELPEKLRVVFIMYQYEHMSYDQIAETLEIPLGTVKSRMHSCLKKLSEKLKHLK